MKEYKRLTEVKEINKYCSTVECGEHCEDCYVGKLYERLAELEDKIENGTLIELPCKVGDTVYYETFKQSGSVGIKPHKVIGFVLEVMTQNIDGFGCTAVPIRDFGKDVFLTEAEAEQRLKELKNDR